jgi:hypothetical protein
MKILFALLFLFLPIRSFAANDFCVGNFSTHQLLWTIQNRDGVVLFSNAAQSPWENGSGYVCIENLDGAPKSLSLHVSSNDGNSGCIFNSIEGNSSAEIAGSGADLDCQYMSDQGHKTEIIKVAEKQECTLNYSIDNSLYNGPIKGTVFYTKADQSRGYIDINVAAKQKFLGYVKSFYLVSGSHMSFRLEFLAKNNGRYGSHDFYVYCDVRTIKSGTGEKDAPFDANATMSLGGKQIDMKITPR